MVREHDAARSDANCRRVAGDRADYDGRRRTRHRWDVVVFCEPVAMIAPRFSMLCEIDRVAQRLCGIAPFDDRRQIEYRKRNHGVPDSIMAMMKGCCMHSLRRRKVAS